VELRKKQKELMKKQKEKDKQAKKDMLAEEKQIRKEAKLREKEDKIPVYTGREKQLRDMPSHQLEDMVMTYKIKSGPSKDAMVAAILKHEAKAKPKAKAETYFTPLEEDIPTEIIQKKITIQRPIQKQASEEPMIDMEYKPKMTREMRFQMEKALRESTKHLPPLRTKREDALMAQQVPGLKGILKGLKEKTTGLKRQEMIDLILKREGLVKGAVFDDYNDYKMLEEQYKIRRDSSFLLDGLTLTNVRSLIARLRDDLKEAKKAGDARKIGNSKTDIDRYTEELKKLERLSEMDQYLISKVKMVAALKHEAKPKAKAETYFTPLEEAFPTEIIQKKITIQRPIQKQATAAEIKAFKEKTKKDQKVYEAEEKQTFTEVKKEIEKQERQAAAKRKKLKIKKKDEKKFYFIMGEFKVNPEEVISLLGKSIEELKKMTESKGLPLPRNPTDDYRYIRTLIAEKYPEWNDMFMKKYRLTPEQLKDYTSLNTKELEEIAKEIGANTPPYYGLDIRGYWIDEILKKKYGK
jgi:hypothetical protein